jgi:hypothetical protein
MFAHVENRKDVRVIQRGGSLRFALEAPPGRQIGKIGGEKLNSDNAIETHINRTIDDTHAARAYRNLNAVWPQSSARRDAGFHDGFSRCAAKLSESRFNLATQVRIVAASAI